MIGPMPGTVISRSQPLSWRANASISLERSSMRASSRRQSPARSSMMRNMRGADADQLEEGLERFGIARDQCAYCGARGSDLDHFFAIVKNKRPSGYFHCARNLVPSCGTCNQSKGGHHWEMWMLGTAKNSPRTRGIPDIEERAERRRTFEKWGGLTPVTEDD